MPQVHFTPHLRAFFDLPDQFETPARSLRDVVTALEAKWPGIGFYITDEQHALRENVAIWIDGKRIPKDAPIDTELADASVVHIMQALSGG